MSKQKVPVSWKPRARIVWTLMVVFAVVLVWRGIWNLADMYFFPGDPLFSNIASILVGALIIYLPDRSLKDLL